MWGRAIKLGQKMVLAESPKYLTQKFQGAPVGSKRTRNPHVVKTLAASDFLPENKIQVHAVSGGQTWLPLGPRVVASHARHGERRSKGRHTGAEH